MTNSSGGCRERVRLLDSQPTVYPQLYDYEIKIVLDSGAYSAWHKKEFIDIHAYIDFCLKYKDCIDHVVNLDVIPGEWGRIPSGEEVEASAQKGWENFLLMKSAGLTVMPVFHMGERLYWLDKMMEECDYVGISPANDKHTNDKRVWLDRIFTHITDNDGWPKIRTHGFGMTSLPLLFRYPWYSADSMSWALVGGYGKVFVPVYRDGGYRYDESPHIVSMSLKSPDMKSDDKHYFSFSDSAKKYVDDYFALKGVTAKELMEDYIRRDDLNAQFFDDLSKNYVATPFAAKRKGFLAA